jgi:DNA-binding XRE family transcriptional regulator
MLTGFQLRAARGALNIFTKDLGLKLGLHYSTVVRLEERTPNLSYLKCNLRTSMLITNFFESQGIVFPNKSTIALKINKDFLEQHASDNKLTRFQLKTARLAMRLTQKLLGEYIGFPQSTLSEIEGGGENLDFIRCDENNSSVIILFFKSYGIIFPNYYTVELTDDPSLLFNQHKKLFDIEYK